MRREQLAAVGNVAALFLSGGPDLAFDDNDLGTHHPKFLPPGIQAGECVLVQIGMQQSVHFLGDRVRDVRPNKANDTV